MLLSCMLLSHDSGGRPTKTQKAAARESANHRGTPIRWNTAVLLLLFWQAELLQALVAVK